MKQSEILRESYGRPSLRMRPLLIGAASLIGLAWAGAAQAQTPERDVAPPKVVPTLAIGSAEIAAPSPPPPEATFPAVEPIIGDAAFEKLIPPIRAEDDAAVDRPRATSAAFQPGKIDRASARERVIQKG